MLNLDIFPSEMCRGCLVCVICNSDSFHSFLFKLCIVIDHTLKMCTFVFCTYFIDCFFVFCTYFIDCFSFFGVLNLDIFHKMLRGFLVCVVRNSNSFHSSIFIICKMIVHAFNMCTTFLLTLHNDCSHIEDVHLLLFAHSMNIC